MQKMPSLQSKRIREHNILQRMDEKMMKMMKKICLGLLAVCSALMVTVTSYAAELSSADSAVVDIEAYEVTEGGLNPGGQITLKLKVKNNSAVSDAANTVVTFESAGGALAPIYGDDNQIYVGTVPAGKTVDVVVDAVVNKQFNLDAAQMICYFSYVSGAVPLNNTVAINIPANVSGNLVVESAYVAENATVGVNALVNIRCKNGGATAITDAKLIATGNIQDDMTEIQLDTIGAGKTLTGDYYVMFTERGNQGLKLELRYTDSKGNECIVDCGEFRVKVIENLSGADYDAVIEKVEGVSSRLMQIVLLAAVVMIGAGVTIGYLRRRH